MGLIVQKYGGTSIANLEMIRNVAKRVGEAKREGQSLVVIVSAMAGETDRLIGLAQEACTNPDQRETDVLISTGEQVSASLLTLCLQSFGYRAISLMGHQIRITTNSDFSCARIQAIDESRLMEELNQGHIVVVAGFQGIDEQGNITTLGRGGSDLTAVAIATVLNADLCEIYTDVKGVYTTDPNICPEARKIKKISYEEMLEMASLGTKVLQTRSVEFAKKYGVVLHVRSSFVDEEGTLVTEEDEEMEKVIVSAVTFNTDEAKITLRRVPDKPGVASRLFTPISEANTIVDMIVQNVSEDGYADLTFTVPKRDFSHALKIVEEVAKELKADQVLADQNIAKVSIIGAGMKTHSGVASKMFTALASEGINIMMISTSEIKVSCVIEEKYTELAVRVLHEAFGLGEGQEVRRES